MTDPVAKESLFCAPSKHIHRHHVSFRTKCPGSVKSQMMIMPINDNFDSRARSHEGWRTHARGCQIPSASKEIMRLVCRAQPWHMAIPRQVQQERKHSGIPTPNSIPLSVHHSRAWPASRVSCHGVGIKAVRKQVYVYRYNILTEEIKKQFDRLGRKSPSDRSPLWKTHRHPKIRKSWEWTQP